MNVQVKQTNIRMGMPRFSCHLEPRDKTLAYFENKNANT
jgi:hypothetical protein